MTGYSEDRPSRTPLGVFGGLRIILVKYRITMDLTDYVGWRPEGHSDPQTTVF